ncbi:M61 family metallopeptidase [Alteromonas sp. H39]|uniref:M61 family metallopeptidase n=1 Tax=Alteromonas sp. H39 TaxID=3389876 RepID=UPI0039E10C3B
MFQDKSVLQYTLSVHSVEEHLFRVTLDLPTHDTDFLELTLPAWIPGSYMIRDFARNIVRLRAEDNEGKLVDVAKTDKQTWLVQTNGTAITLTYDIYAFDLSVRSAFINDEYAFCNGTSVFLQVKGAESLPCSLQINTVSDKPDWLIETSMPSRQENAASMRFYCENYEELIDHPVFIGSCQLKSFDVNGVEFVLLFSGKAPIDTDRIARDLVPVCKHHMQLFGEPQPISRYVFMTLLSDSGFGGLEHRSSTALLYPRFDLPLVNEPEDKTDGYITFLSLCSHELFHTWHVKRIKPEVMVKPDLQAETYTEQLWIYEGFTSFYDDLTLVRAGLIEPEKYLDIVAQNLSRLQVNAGRFKQSAAESSFDAWTRFYKQDASATNHIVSYYTKGGIIAMGLDLLLRTESQGKYNLDNLMKVLWDTYGRDEKGTPNDVIASLCQQHFGIDVNPYLKNTVFGVEDVPLPKWLDSIGVALKLRAKSAPDDKGGVARSAKRVGRAFGAVTKTLETGMMIQVVRQNTPASRAGLQVNDKLIAMNGYVVNPALFQRLLDNTTDQHAELLVIREGRTLSLSMPIEKAAEVVCYFDITDREKLMQWLKVDD